MRAHGSCTARARVLWCQFVDLGPGGAARNWSGSGLLPASETLVCPERWSWFSLVLRARLLENPLEVKSMRPLRKASGTLLTAGDPAPG